MIIDSISNYKFYCSLNPYFEKAFQFVLKNITTIENGRYEIDGDNVYVMFVETEMKQRDSAPLEVHNKYIDIQIPISKTECFGVKAREKCSQPQSEFNNENDILFFDDTPSNFINISNEEFVVFFPLDAHAPLIGDGTIRKAIIKIISK